MPISNLPPFREGAQFAPPNQAGKWVKAPGSLKQLGQSLEVDEDRPSAAHATIIRAIPDPWAQARTFAEAVLDEKHSMHKTAIAQWRGLLALFALAELRKTDYSLDHESLALGDEHPFERVLKHLSPKLAVAGNSDLWLTPHIVYIQPKLGRALPIAMLNPASLVSPGRTTWQLPFDYIPWMRSGLSDPLDLTGDKALSGTQLAALAAYLENLRDTIPEATTDGPAGALREAVDAYLRQVVARKANSPMTATVRRPRDSSLHALYQNVVLPAELDEPEDPAAVSECRVQLLKPESLAPLKGVVLIDESLAGTLKRPPRDIIAWGNRTLSELLDSPHALQEVQRQAAELGWLVATADDLFTPRLIRLRKDPRIPGHNADMRDMLEPIRPLALLLDQTATRGLDVDRSERRTTVTLHLKLDKVSSAHAISRTYRAEEGSSHRLVNEVDWDFGQTSVWPNFKSSQWPYYFTRLTYPTTREQIRPQFAMSRDIIAAAIASPPTSQGAGPASQDAAPTPQRAVQTLQAINNGGAPAEKADWYRRFQNVAGKAYEELQTSSLPFDVIFYIDYHPDRGEAPAGCVRLKLLEPRAADNRATVAVDFGSTNTIACMSGTGGQPITLKGRIVHPIVFQDTLRNDEWQHIVRWNYLDFLPLTDRKTPTPTVVISRTDADRDADLWLFRNLIYFQPIEGHASGGLAGEITNLQTYLKRAQFNLKWNEDHLDASADFLEQFMTMVAAEAAAAEYNPRLIEWHFSVPDAMQDRRLESFRSQVEVARETLSPDGHLHDLYSEGLAAARFILAGKEGSKFTQGSINAILDIGGSTTDITLWANDVLVWKGSFRLAGRAFFTETMVQNPKILREIELGDWADLLDPITRDRVAVESVVDIGELLFSRPALDQAFDKHWNRRLNAKAGETLRSTALVFISGIAYYLGLVARKLVEEGTLSEQDLARPAFALCGRGAGIFNRMHGGQTPDRQSQVTLALQTFSRAAGLEPMPRPQLFISKQPKLEVAAGMMVAFDAIDARVGNGTPKSSFTPAGLQVEFADGTSLDAAEPIGTALTARAARGSNLEALGDFLTALEELSGISVNLRHGSGQGAFNEISTVVRQKVDRQKNDQGEIRLAEPPFITALGALVSIMASPEEERTARLGVEVKG